MRFLYIKNFSEVLFNDKPDPGSSSFFLGEAFDFLKFNNINAPEGFVISRNGYDHFLEQDHLKHKISTLLSAIDTAEFKNLKQIGLEIRSMIMSSNLPEPLQNEIHHAWETLKNPQHSALRLAIRLGLDTPRSYLHNINNFHELFFNISDEEELIRACIKCYESLFTDDEIRHRIIHSIDHFSPGITICVHKMVRSDLACSGIIHLPAPEDIQTGSVQIEGTWGMIENIFYKKVEPDLFTIPVDALAGAPREVIHKKTGSKMQTLIYFDLPDYTKKPTFVNIETLETKRHKNVLKDSEVLQLAKWGLEVAGFYKSALNITWAKDGITNALYLVRILQNPSSDPV